MNPWASLIGSLAPVTIGAFLSARLLERRDRTTVRCDGEEWDGGHAHLCQRKISRRRAHRVAEVEPGEFGGGTAMVADYCPKHCPGGCNQGCPKRPEPSQPVSPSQPAERRARSGAERHRALYGDLEPVPDDYDGLTED